MADTERFCFLSWLQFVNARQILIAQEAIATASHKPELKDVT